jgi:hypothetical protein
LISLLLSLTIVLSNRPKLPFVLAPELFELEKHQSFTNFVQLLIPSGIEHMLATLLPTFVATIVPLDDMRRLFLTFRTICLRNLSEPDTVLYGKPLSNPGLYVFDVAVYSEQP